MMRKTVAVCSMLLVVMAPGIAQPPGVVADKDDADYEEAPEYELSGVLEGDAVIFKSGKELRGVKIIRENPIFVEVEYLPGEPPLQLPRAQIDRIEYASDMEKDIRDILLLSDLTPEEDVSAEFHRMLMTPMTTEELEIEDGDFLLMLREFAARFNIEIVVAEALQTLPPEARQFSLVIPADTQLFDFLRTHLAAIAPQVRVLLQYEKLVLQAREEPAPVSEETPPEAPPEE